MKYNEIIGLIQEMTKTGLTKLKIEQGEFRLLLEQGKSSNEEVKAIPAVNVEQTAHISQDTTIINEQGKETNEDKKELQGKKILSPMVGTFYAQPAPDKPPFVKVGDKVKKGQIVCIIEAMKLMNEIESEVDGEIVECLVENEDMVEFGQPLFVLK